MSGYDPYEHTLDDGVVCKHRPKPGDTEGRYESRRGPALAFTSPVERDLYDYEQDVRDADSEDHWWAEKRAAEKAAAPTFEQILADPTSQPDKDGAVLRSILDYGSRKVCGATIEVTSNTAGGVPAVISPSRYICTKPLPCPEHSS